MAAGHRMIVGIFVTIIVAALIVIHIAETQAVTNYENQLSSCIAGNPIREAVVLGLDTSSEVGLPKKARHRYSAAADKIFEAPYVNDATGKRDCNQAVKHP